MIPRYSRPEMAAIWSPETRFRIWFEIEAHAHDAHGRARPRPARGGRSRSGRRARKAVFDVARIDAIEREVKHDVIAFLTHLAEIVGPEARFVHQGMTSSDVLDTCFTVQLVARRRPPPRRPRRAARRPEAPRLRAQAHADHRPLARHPRRADHLRPQARAGLCRVRARPRPADRGAPRESRPAPSRARSAPSPMSTRASRRTSPRRWGSRSSRSRRRSSRATATPCTSRRSRVIASSVERLATEIRHLQRTEVLEAEEYFAEGQKGSSAMPHKRNPVLTENLTGLARMVRAYALPALENVALWHERDISHSSVERMIGPDATVTLDFALAPADRRDRQARRLSGEHAAEPRPARRARPFAARAAGADPEGRRRARTPTGSSSATPCRSGAARATSCTLLEDRPGGRRGGCRQAELEALFDLGYHLKHVDTIFRRVFGP